MTNTLVSLDFGGTLDGTGVAPCEQRWAYYRAAGYRFDRERLRQAHIATRDRLLRHPDAPQWTIEERVDAWIRLECENLLIHDDRIARWVADFATGERARLREAEEPLRRLADRHLLAVVSNNIGNVEKILRDTGLRTYFAVVVDSAVCGYRKPDPRIFADCQRQAGVRDPRRCWHLGDEWRKDVVGAQSAGWHAVLFVQPGTSDTAPAPRHHNGVPIVDSLDGYGRLVS